MVAKAFIDRGLAGNAFRTGNTGFEKAKGSADMNIKVVTMYCKFVYFLGCKVTRFWLLVCILLSSQLLTQSSMAAPITILTLDETRIGSYTNANGTLNLNFVTGDSFQTVREALLDPTNFGPGGTVPRSVALTSAPAINTNRLGGTDVILLPAMPRFHFEDCERCAIESFVRQGGGLFVSSNYAAHYFADMVGATETYRSKGVYTKVSNGASPVANGPFGALATGTEISNGYLWLFDSLGPNGTDVLVTRDADEDIVAASFTLGLGRVVLFNDEELFMNRGVPGMAAARLTRESLMLFLNAISYVAPNESFRYVPEDCGCVAASEPEIFMLLLLGLAGTWFWWHSRDAYS